ncbi:MAG: Integrase core domain protein [Streptosporangiaceae bacterium]|nr:Integrase core domain protein [Streptosporangiaceae bacterium]
MQVVGHRPAEHAAGEHVEHDREVAPAGIGAVLVELLDRQRRNTRIELANAMFDYLEIFHNRRRRHSALDWLTPIEFENRTSITVA